MGPEQCSICAVGKIFRPGNITASHSFFSVDPVIVARLEHIIHHINTAAQSQYYHSGKIELQSVRLVLSPDLFGHNTCHQYCTQCCNRQKSVRKLNTGHQHRGNAIQTLDLVPREDRQTHTHSQNGKASCNVAQCLFFLSQVCGFTEKEHSRPK